MSALVEVNPDLDVPRLLNVLRAVRIVRMGDFSVRLPDEWTGVAGKVADTLNEVIELNEHFAAELKRLNTLVGERGRLQERDSVGSVTGAWAASVANISSLIASLGQPTSEAARVIGAVAKGDLSQRIALDIDGRPLEGELLRTARSVNRMVDQLSSFAAEVTRVAREVVVEGKLGGQARVPGPAGTWKDLTDNVNQLAANLTTQVRAIAEVATAARAAAEAEGRLSFLADVGRILTRSLNTPTTLVRDLLDLFVPRLADLAAVSLISEDQTSWRSLDATGSVTADPPATRAAQAIDEALRRAMARGEAEILDGAQETLQGLVLPLVARGRTVGAVGAGLVRSARRYAEADFDLIRLVAGRAAITLDNSRLYREIQERDRQKDEFLAMLSHELRNPLGAITMAAHLLEPIRLKDDRAIRARNVLIRQTAHLARMVDDLLDVARVTSDRVTLTCVSVDLADVVRRAMDALRVSGGLDHHEIALKLEPVTVEVDTARMEQVITKLVVNAVKYTEAGGRIEVEAGAEGAEAVVRVCDTGIGMSQEMLQRLFQPFAQERQALDRARGGLGIGLTLVRRLIELQGGRVEASSAGPGRGSTFILKLPRASPAAHEDAEPRQATERPLRILIVEDNDDAREMLRTLLELAGHETHEAADGLEGLRLAAEVKPHVALVDLGLPGLDGLQLAPRIRAIPGGDAIELVALTGYGQTQDRQRTRAAGFDQHVVKPVDTDTLGKVLALAAQRSLPIR